jgi:hypothetical protein
MAIATDCRVNQPRIPRTNAVRVQTQPLQ